jgi:RNA polymerase sigma factor (sigma-70 family)
MRETILMNNYNLVLKVFHSFKGEAFNCLKGNETDAIHEGVMGLTKAIERYDPSTGNRFSTFAYPCIRGAILQYVRDKHHPIRFSQVKSERVVRYWKMMARLKGLNVSIDRVDFDNSLPALEKLFEEAKARLSNPKDKALTFDRWVEDAVLYSSCRRVIHEMDSSDDDRKERTWTDKLSKDYNTFTGDRFFTPPSQIDPRVERVIERLEKVAG